MLYARIFCFYYTTLLTLSQIDTKLSDFATFIRSGQLDNVIKCLVELYAIEIDIESIKISISSSQLKVLEYLANKTPDFHQLKLQCHLIHHAVKSNSDISVIEYLLNGENINSFLDNQGRNPIFDCREGELFKFLLEQKGADIHAQDKIGRTPLLEALHALFDR